MKCRLILKSSMVVSILLGQAGCIGTFSAELLKVPIGKISAVELSDQTKITANSVSEVSYPLKSSKKRWALHKQGEALYQISPASEPFVIEVTGLLVKTVSGQINVNIYPEHPGAVITVVSGKVAVQIGKSIKLVNAGQQLIAEDEKKTIVHAANIDSATSWTRGIQKFTNGSIKEIAPVIYRWYGEKVIIDRSDAGDIKMHITLNKNLPLSSFTEMVNLLGSTRFYYEDGKLHYNRVIQMGF